MTTVCVARIHILLAVAALSADSVASAQIIGGELDAPPPATGFVPPTRGETLRVREIRGARRRAPLARTGDAATSLPSRWDSREKGWVSSVKSQGSFGTCWAFASLATLETQLLRKGLAEPDFSEKNLVNLSASSLSFNDGGNFDTAAGCLLRWSGPVTEANDPYVTGPTIWTAEGGSAYWSDAYDAGLYARDTNGWALCIKAYTSNTASVPAEDAPDLVDNGAAMLRDLAATDPALYAETFSFDALSALAGANGRSLWASWLAGLDPGDPDDAAFTVSISITNGAPCITWDPDLGDSRSYTVWGRDALDSGDTWRPVDPSDPGATGARFFKVSVGR